MPSATVVNEEILMRSSSQAHCGSATIWPNHQVMRAAMKKKMMILPARYPLDKNDREMWRLVSMRYIQMNISAQNAMIRKTFPQMVIFF